MAGAGVCLLAAAFVCAFLLSACHNAQTDLPFHVLRVGWTAEPGSLNPLSDRGGEASRQITNLIYEPLVAYDSNLEISYRLAESCEYSLDSLTRTYKLRENAFWHDGAPVTANDVLWTYKAVKEYDLGEFSYLLQYLEGISAPDDHTVTLRFSRPQLFDAAPAIPILPAHIWGEMDADALLAYENETPVGSGPLVFEEWIQGATLSLRKNPVYYGPEPGPDQILFYCYADETQMSLALRSNKADIVMGLSPGAWDGLKDEADIRTASLPAFAFHMGCVNVSQSDRSRGNPLLLDKTVRLVLGYALDRVRIVNSAVSGRGAPGGVLIPPAMEKWQYSLMPEEVIDNDAEKARLLLDEAGYVDDDGDGIREKDGLKLEFRLFAAETDESGLIAARLFSKMAEDIGISLLFTEMDEAAMNRRIRSVNTPDYDICIRSRDFVFPDPSAMTALPLTDRFGTDNETYYANPAYDELYARQLAETDAAARKELLDQMQRMYYGDAVCFILWYHEKLQAYRTDRWTGFSDTPGGIVGNIVYDNYLNIRPAE
ncbi:MAG: ABC transporter substrate-binding protein [Clostridiales Family XIII bacterium]|nr:ABC transporter substrate-binding protein [Clostridiales Family XIII bacterium]